MNEFSKVAHDATREVLLELKKENLFEAPDTSQVLLEDSGRFVAASLAKTVQLVSHHLNVDIELVMTFLHVYGALMLPTDLIALLRARWHMDAPQTMRVGIVCFFFFFFVSFKQKKKGSGRARHLEKAHQKVCQESYHSCLAVVD
jgi:hypothetical protein